MLLRKERLAKLRRIHQSKDDKLLVGFITLGRWFHAIECNDMQQVTDERFPRVGSLKME